MTMQLIETKTLGTAAASITFTSIPQDGTDLVLLISGRTARASEVDGIALAFNGSSASFSARRLFGSGSSAFSDTVNGHPFFSGASSTSNTFGNTTIYIPNYTASINKAFSVDGAHENNATLSYQGMSAGLWSNTAAITEIGVSSEVASNLQVGSTISLYKITKGSDGIVTTS
jgi:hypothetical protein